ncbi:hypothetical protein GIB67_031578 [Kingdonia uniflora]|uniref:GEX2 N-terminal Ig-like domain-containing protein n=1 Tax=Kingdonia uniflora TaxID=39325 RepID=A0A7J7PBF7_9MAGN|nr:hypothetical protein GIB67_031578 [Kingdonia uniflora]
MISQTLLYIILTTIVSTIIPTPTLVLAYSDTTQPLPAFAFSWLSDNNTFAAGDIATIKIKVLGGSFDSKKKLVVDGHQLNLTIVVNEKTGNSSIVSAVLNDVDGDSNDWGISFVPILMGVFNVYVYDDRFGVYDSSLHFQVLPGRLYPSVCVASWRGLVNEFVAGARASILVLPKDAFGNNISSTSEEPSLYKFMVSAIQENGSAMDVLNLTYTGWTGFGYVGIEFVASTIGNFLLHIEGGNQTLNSSPLPFKVKPGQLDVTKCLGTWSQGTNAFQIFSKLEIFIDQKDRLGNLVPGFYAFDTRVVEKWTNLSIPVANLYFKEVVPGIQLLSFSVLEPGKFVLTIFDMEQNQSISNMPYDYTVFVGYCDGLNSVVNGSGLSGSIAGRMSKFSVYLQDLYHNPSPVEAEQLRVQILRTIDSYSVWPIISPIQIDDGKIVNATAYSLLSVTLFGPDPTGDHIYGTSLSMGSSLAPSVDSRNSSGTNLKVQASDYDVTYTPERSGIYEIQIFCGNILLNGGHPYTMEVKPGISIYHI